MKDHALAFVINPTLIALRAAQRKKMLHVQSAQTPAFVRTVSGLYLMFRKKRHFSSKKVFTGG
ncbi:hypothetical protein, partial [Thalassospira sp. TSL5-1]|uniref:hypothetical protein n=1 Tax=Thalassospira sp. TSL5-1 TaxID=1544451 RepID=UPI001C065025